MFKMVFIKIHNSLGRIEVTQLLITSGSNISPEILNQLQVYAAEIRHQALINYLKQVKGISNILLVF